jgi:uncharacterized protein (TIGR00661 family)
LDGGYVNMNIIYTINGEGMGHASRSSVIIDHLLAQGHKVKIFSAGEKPVAFLRHKFGSVAEVTGLHMVYRKNKVRRLQTAVKALGKIKVISKDLASIRQSLSQSWPEVVITDFDFHGGLISRLTGAPLISIDNIQYITQAKYTVAPEDFIDYELGFAITKMIVPKADYYFITTFNPAAKLKNQKKKENIFFVPPVLRSKIRNIRPIIGKHVLVYQTSDSYTKLFKILAQSKEKFIVYNARPKINVPSVICKKFDENFFIRDLASAKAVIVNGGFNVITESLYLQKPVLAIPIKNHFEQKLNATMLRQLGLGATVKRLSKKSLDEFMAQLDRYKSEIAKLKFDDKPIFAQLDALLKKIRKR